MPEERLLWVIAIVVAATAGALWGSRWRTPSPDQQLTDVRLGQRHSQTSAEDEATSGRSAHLVEQYKLLTEFARFEHTRWSDNYRIFLTVAGFLIAAEGAVLASQSSRLGLPWFVLSVAVLGALVGLLSLTFITRPDKSANLWYWMLRDFERAHPLEFAPIFCTGRRVMAPAAGSTEKQVPAPFGMENPMDVVPRGWRPFGYGRLTVSALALCGLFVMLQIGTAMYALHLVSSGRGGIAGGRGAIPFGVTTTAPARSTTTTNGLMSSTTITAPTTP
jgi:hypothetical protein